MVKSFRSKPTGWQNESQRHSLAAKGVKTSYMARDPINLGKMYVDSRDDAMRQQAAAGEDINRKRALMEKPLLNKQLSDQEKAEANTIVANTLEKPSTRVLREQMAHDVETAGRWGLPTDTFERLGRGESAKTLPGVDESQLKISRSTLISELDDELATRRADLKRLEIQKRRSRGELEAELGQYLTDDDVVEIQRDASLASTVQARKIEYLKKLKLQFEQKTYQSPDEQYKDADLSRAAGSAIGKEYSPGPIKQTYTLDQMKAYIKRQNAPKPKIEMNISKMSPREVIAVRKKMANTLRALPSKEKEANLRKLRRGVR